MAKLVVNGEVVGWKFKIVLMVEVEVSSELLSVYLARLKFGGTTSPLLCGFFFTSPLNSFVLVELSKLVKRHKEILINSEWDEHNHLGLAALGSSGLVRGRRRGCSRPKSRIVAVSRFLKASISCVRFPVKIVKA